LPTHRRSIRRRRARCSSPCGTPSERPRTGAGRVRRPALAVSEATSMIDVRQDPDRRASQDERELIAFGYAQELFRSIGGFSNFALSFSIISMLTGAVTLYQHGLVMGGPAEMAFGWPLVALFTMTVALSMAELASAVPTSGALYHWACRLGGRGCGWLR